MNELWPCANGNTSTSGCVDVATPMESFRLRDGDLLVMRGETQRHWHHRVPRERGRGVRLNVNFRYILPGMDAERGQMTYYKYMVYGDCPVGDGLPKSWTFEKIMAKKGGMRNFVRLSADMDNAKRKRQLNNDEDNMMLDRCNNESTCVHNVKCGQVTTIESFKKTLHQNGSKKNISMTNICNDCDQISVSEIRQFLSSNETVDRSVFLSLPSCIQNELVSQWKANRQSESTPETAWEQTVAMISPSTGRTLTQKRKMVGINSLKAAKPKKSAKGTLDTFFAKK